MDTKHIYIVLIRSSTVLSRIIAFFTKSEYTHASIALDKELRKMYSFGRKWSANPFIGCFKREIIDNDLLYSTRNTTPSVILEIPVTKQQYKRIHAKIKNFLKENGRYRYNYFGLLANYFRLQYKNDDRFFCSEFVYHILHESGVFDLSIPREFVRPQDFLRIKNKIIYEGDFKGYSLKYN